MGSLIMPQDVQMIADAKNAAYKRKYDNDVQRYTQAATGWQAAQVINIQNGLPVQPFVAALPVQTVVTINPEGHLEEDYAPVDLSLTPALPNVTVQPQKMAEFQSGAPLDVKQDSMIGEILDIVKRIDAKT